MQGCLVKANLQQKEGPLAEVVDLLDTLQEAWSQVGEPETAHAGP
jgi:flagellin-specific chaperone FliS